MSVLWLELQHLIYICSIDLKRITIKATEECKERICKSYSHCWCCTSHSSFV